MGRRAVSIYLSILIIIGLLNLVDFIIETTPILNAEDPPPDDDINGIQYIYGDWNISDNQTYTDEIIILTGNLTVLGGGNLTFYNVTLIMNNTQIDAEYNIEVFRGGTFNVLSDSMITDSLYDIDDESSSDYEFMFWVREGSNFSMRDSELHECGYYWFSGGLIIETDGVLVDNNLISHCYIGIRIGSSHSIITNNLIQHSLGGVYLWGSKDNTIAHNEIYNTSTGISLDLGSHRNNISNNEIYKYHSSGISLHQGSDLNIINKNIIHDGKYGISIGGGGWSHDFITISNNIIYNNSEAGLYLIGLNIGPGKYSNHEGNILYNNTCGIFISGSNHNDFNRTIIYNSTVGIKIWGGHENRFINSSISDSYDHDIYFIESDWVIGELTLLNTTFYKSKIFFEGNQTNLTIQWYLHIYASYFNDTPISGANIEVRDSNDDLVKSGLTDENGFLKWIVVTARIQNRTTNISFNPHNISVMKDSIILYAIPEPVINRTMQVNIPPKPLHHIRIIPEGPNSYTIGDTQTYTAVGWDDAPENRLNTTWQPVWTVEGNIGEITGDGYTVTFKATKPGIGKIICTDENTGYTASIEIQVEGEVVEQEFPWMWVLLTTTLVFIILITILIYRKKKNPY